MSKQKDEDRLLEGLLLGPEIKFGDVMNGQYDSLHLLIVIFDELTLHSRRFVLLRTVIESFERARGATLFFDQTERERTKIFFDSRAGESTPRDNAMDIIKMLRVEADRMLSEDEKTKQDKVVQITSDDNDEDDSFEKINKASSQGNGMPPGAFKRMDLQERRRTSSEYRIRGSSGGNQTSSSSSSDEGGSEKGVEESLLLDEQEPTMMDDSGVASPSRSEVGSSRPSSALNNRSRKSSTLSINTQYPESDSSRQQRARTAQGVSFPRENLVSPPRSSFSRTSTSGIPRATRRSDPSKSISSNTTPGSSSSIHPPSSFNFGSPSKPRPGRARSGSAESTSRVNVPQGAFGMGVPYGAGLGAGAGSRPPSVGRSRRSSGETVVGGDEEREVSRRLQEGGHEATKS